MIKAFLKRLKKPKVTVVRLQGMIAASGRGVLSDAALRDTIEKAFAAKPQAVALQINSPGGSPVQSALIAARIRRLAQKDDIPVLAFVEDVAASGGYWLACAADEIYADRASVVGSIGVISAGFGVPELLNKMGIERRVYTAGESKSTLDPFREENPQDVERLKSLLEDVHDEFKSYVRSRRGSRLAEDDSLFTGAFWTAARGKGLGLVDGFGDLDHVLREKFGDKVKIKHISQKTPFLAKLGFGAMDAAMGKIEERALFSRFGV